MIRLSAISVILLSVASVPASSQQPAAPDWSALSRPRTHVSRPTTAAITAQDLASRLYPFAHDSMQGRNLGTAGNARGVEYLAREARAIGLEPAGDNGTYFQTIGLVDRVLDTTAQFAAGGTTFVPWTDYVVRDQGRGARSISGVQTIYGGTWGDSATLIDSAAVAGKLVVLNISPAGYAPGSPGGPSRAAVSRHYASAAGIVIAGLDLATPQLMQVYRQPLSVLQRQGVESPAVPAVIYATKRTASALMGTSIEAVKVGAAGVTVTSGPRIAAQQIEFPARNVVGIIRGSDPSLRNQYVAIGSHNDHVGFNKRPVAHDSIYILNHLFRTGGADDPTPRLNEKQAAQINAALADIRRRTSGASARPDSIYNGADDDGSGSVSLLEIAQYLAAQKVKPKRSMLFIWHVGEEAGLFGSEWFTDNPTVPRDSIVAQLNLDMVGRGAVTDVTGVNVKGGNLKGGPAYVQLIGSRRLSTELGDLAESVNVGSRRPLSFDYGMDANGHPQNIYCRSDHYEYARYGIPVIFFTTGGHADYHQVTDEPQYIDYDRLAHVSNYIASLGARIANLDHRLVVDKPKPDPKAVCVQ
ncbi:MAG TPA: M28 family peptidase [Gemmatimonadaceae bacterium]|nr:M28 family peptidase [Gemmatimonadaceae bacterium]